MNAYWLTLKRILRSVGFPIFLLIVAAAIFAAPFLGRDEALPPAAVFDADKSAISEQVMAQLTENGFLVCQSEEELREGIRKGEYDCGAILPQGFSGMLEGGELKESIVFISSPTSFVPELHRSHVAASVYSVYAPYISATYMDDIGIPRDEVVAQYNEKMAEGNLFKFEIAVGETLIIPENERAITYTVAAAAMLLFALLVYGSCDVLTRDCTSMMYRIGIKQTVLRILVPGMTVRVVSAMLASVAALLLAVFILGESFCMKLVFPTCIYILLLAGYSIVLSAIFKKGGHIQIVSCFVVLLSLVLCPIYTDLALVFPWVAALRYLAPPYWLWAAIDHPFICLGAAVILPVVAILLMCLRWRRRMSGRAVH